jgi:hypothetical protein
MNKIVLIGTGNLGKRYIQAISRIKYVNLFLADISIEALQSTAKFISDNGLNSLQYKIIGDINDIFTEIDQDTIVIISSTAADRGILLKKVILRTPKAIICEKPVTQSNEEYLELIGLIEKLKVKSFVNFTLRMQPFFQKIKLEIDNPENGVFLANLPKLGLACVGIHQIDLFMWLFNISQCELINSSFSKIYEQKRPGFFDVIGSIEIKSAEFHGFINNSGVENLRTVQILTKDKVYNVFEDQRVLNQINKNNSELNFSETISYSFVSQYMTDLIQKIITNKFESIDLPSIESSYFQHKLIFDYLSKHSFSKLNFT